MTQPQGTGKLTERERQVMLHALTGGNSDKFYRNYFAAGGKDQQVWLGLVARGYAEETTPSKLTRNFGVTDAGRAALKSKGEK